MSTIIALLIQYKYLLIVPFAIAEGPLITIICGFLVSLGYLNPFVVYPVVVLGDMAGDSLFYGIGRFAGRGFIKKFGKRFGITEEKLEHAKNYFQLHHKKALAFSKLVHGIGAAGILAAGSLKTSYKKFVLICGTISASQSIVLLILGILFGKAYNVIGQYLNYYAAAATAIALIVATVIILKHIKLPFLGDHS